MFAARLHARSNFCKHHAAPPHTHTPHPQSLWSFVDMTNTWRFIKLARFLFGRLKSCCWFALLKSFCLAVCLINRAVSVFPSDVGVHSIGREGHWRMEIYWRGNQWLSCQADAWSSHPPSQCYWKGLTAFDYCWCIFFIHPWKALCALMCVSFRPLSCCVLIFTTEIEVFFHFFASTTITKRIIDTVRSDTVESECAVKSYSIPQKYTKVLFV